MKDNHFILEMRNITKTFPGTVALDDVSFDCKAGEVHVLVGANGAGKSTLMKILAGVHTCDQGMIYLDGEKVEINNVSDSQEYGIGIIHQELNLLRNKTVYDNIFIGDEITNKYIPFMVDKAKMKAESRKLLATLKCDISPDKQIKDLGIAHQQIVEIAKAIRKFNKILIMDEPTSSLTSLEIENLFELIRDLREQGCCIIYISHRLEEIFRIGDRITVLRDGKKVLTDSVENMTMEELIAAMAGRETSRETSFVVDEVNQVKTEEEILKIVDLSAENFKECNLVLHKGEIVTITGMVGSGRTELVRAIFGADKILSGDLYLFGEKVIKPNLKANVEQGLGFLPENRKEQGLLMGMKIRENITLASLRSFFPSGIINTKKEVEIGKKYITELGIVGNTESLPAVLSGGNQQKVILAKWLSTHCSILIFDEPTRGIDVCAKEEIYELMQNLVKQGAAILVVSSDQLEVTKISNRVYVMRDGQITGELCKEQITWSNVLSLAI